MPLVNWHAFSRCLYIRIYRQLKSVSLILHRCSFAQDELTEMKWKSNLSVGIIIANVEIATVTADKLAGMLKLATLCKYPRVIKLSVTGYFFLI